MSSSHASMATAAALIILPIVYVFNIVFKFHAKASPARPPAASSGGVDLAPETQMDAPPASGQARRAPLRRLFVNLNHKGARPAREDAAAAAHRPPCRTSPTGLDAAESAHPRSRSEPLPQAPPPATSTQPPPAECSAAHGSVKCALGEMPLGARNDPTAPTCKGTSVPTNEATLEGSLVVMMVGLPARGKSYIVQKLMRYLKWQGSTVKVFNVGSYRRESGKVAAKANDFFGNDQDSRKARDQMARDVQDHMYEWMARQPGTCIGMFDATNTTAERRAMLMERCKAAPGVGMLFIESICTDHAILHHNYCMKLKNDDYKDMDTESALADFKARVALYESVYESIQDSEDGGNVSYIKLFNVGQKICSFNCHGYLPSHISFYLQNIHIGPRKIWLTHHAESLDLVRGVLGGDRGDLTLCGEQYSAELAKFIAEQHTDKLLVLSGTQSVHAQTLRHMKELPCIRTALLNELRGGDLDGLTRTDIMRKYPNLHSERVRDKFRFRYPGAAGESYFDVTQRVKPIIIELERQRQSLLVVCHLAVLRCIYAYFAGVNVEDIPYLNVNLHAVYELSPGASGCPITEHVLSKVSREYIDTRRAARTLRSIDSTGVDDLMFGSQAAHSPGSARSCRPTMVEVHSEINAGLLND